MNFTVFKWRIILFYSIQGGGGSHPDPELRVGGGLWAGSIFLGLQASVWSKNKREGAVRPPPTPPLDTPLYLAWLSERAML